MLGFINTPHITGSYNASIGVLTLSGTDTLANYQAALRSVTYEDTGSSPQTGIRSLIITFTDGYASAVRDER